MQLHTLKSTTQNRRKKRVGRGGKRGTFSGRGTKGLGARAGGKFRPEERDILKRIPKLRGYKFKSFRSRPVAINFPALQKVFKPGEEVSPQTLVAKGLLRKQEGKFPVVKILGLGAHAGTFLLRNVLTSRSSDARTGSESGKNSARKKVPASRKTTAGKAA
ncbi:MAG: uL15 family ribosomal protein [Candidatus Sungbacteria bacterium]|nr:uL15 family ribosomal protein [Candidatus Sungbacteria bacterium]